MSWVLKTKEEFVRWLRGKKMSINLHKEAGEIDIMGKQSAQQGEGACKGRTGKGTE